MGMTVSRLRAELTNREYTLWSMYHQRRAQKQELESKRGKAGKSGRGKGR